LIAVCVGLALAIEAIEMQASFRCTYGRGGIFHMNSGQMNVGNKMEGD